MRLQSVDVVFRGASPIRLSAGDTCSFGRHNDANPPDLAISRDQRVSKHAGNVVAFVGGWIVQNTSTYQPVRVIDNQGLNAITLPSVSQNAEELARTATVTWKDARIELSFDALEAIEISVRASFSQSEGVENLRSITTEPVVDVDRDRVYYAALLALCEPRLRSPESMIVPTNAQISDRLLSTGVDPGATGDRVQKSIERARDKFGLPQGLLPDNLLPNVRPLLIEAAIAVGAVSLADLDDLGFDTT